MFVVYTNDHTDVRKRVETALVDGELEGEIYMEV